MFLQETMTRMFVSWALLALCATSALARSVQRPDAAVSRVGELEITPLAEVTQRKTLSDVSWLQSRPKHLKRSDMSAKYEQNAKRLFFSDPKRRTKRASPSTDEVTDGPASSWLRKSLPKTNFITAREHRTEKLKPSDDDEQRNLSVRTNEIPAPSLRPRSESTRTGATAAGDDVPSEPRHHAPTRRIIYYASLPEISSKPNENPTSQRRYEPLPLRPKYSRDSSRDEGLARSKPLAIDRYRYRPTSRVNSYTIIDSEQPQPQPQSSDNRNYPARTSNYPERSSNYPERSSNYPERSSNYPERSSNYPERSSNYPERSSNYPERSSNYQELSNSKYNKIPAPYRPNEAGRNPTAPSSPSLYDNGYPRNREPAVDPGALVRDEPYRDYNPRQPAPWSVQIGTRLTVKDDGRPFRRDDGRPFRQDDDGQQRRFYVNSQSNQDKTRYAPDEDRTRYRLL